MEIIKMTDSEKYKQTILDAFKNSKILNEEGMEVLKLSLDILGNMVRLEMIELTKQKLN